MEKTIWVEETAGTNKPSSYTTTTLRIDGHAILSPRILGSPTDIKQEHYI